MASVATTIPVPDNRKYPWETWLDGQVWKLEKGVDYESYMSVVGCMQSYAKRNGIKCMTRKRTQNGKEYLYIRALPSE